MNTKHYQIIIIASILFWAVTLQAYVNKIYKLETRVDRIEEKINPLPIYLQRPTDTSIEYDQHLFHKTADGKHGISSGICTGEIRTVYETSGEINQTCVDKNQNELQLINKEPVKQEEIKI